MAGGLGFEPRLTESESAVLPLDDPPIRSPLGSKAKAAFRRPSNFTSLVPESLALRVLRPLAGLVQAVLLALHGAGVAGDEARLAQRRPQVRVVRDERAGDAVADGAGLAARPAALHVHVHVEAIEHVERRERLLHDHARRL